MEYTKEYNFLSHFLNLIETEVNERSPLSKCKDEFEKGRTMSMYMIAELIVECSQIFEMPLEDLGLADFNPGKLL